MPPLPISDEKLEHHIVTTLGDVFVLVHMASHYNTRARTVYYKCAFILLATVIEALVYHFMECHCNADNNLVSKDNSTELKKLLEIHKNHTGSDKKLWLAEEVDVEASFKGVTKDFNKMNDFCKAHLGISNKLYNQLTYVRAKRNEIHLQGLDSKRRSWTKLQINKAGSVMVQMLNELEAFNPT